MRTKYVKQFLDYSIACQREKIEKLLFTSQGKAVLWHLLSQEGLGGPSFYS